MRLPTNDKHLNFRWLEPECKVLFSVAQQGTGASCHFASDKRGMKKIKQAINEFVEFVFWLFPWCDAIIAKVSLKLVEDIIVDCQFEKVLKTDYFNLFIRKKT